MPESEDSRYGCHGAQYSREEDHVRVGVGEGAGVALVHVEESGEAQGEEEPPPQDLHYRHLAYQV